MIQKNFLLRALVIALAVTISACGSAEDRAVKYVERAKASFEAEDYVKAQLDLKNALQIAPDSVEARYMLAEIAEKERNPRGMFTNLRAVVELDPTHVEARVKLGSIYLLTNHLDEASEQVEAALELDPQNPSARVLRASLLRKLGDDEGSLAEVESVLADEPGNVAAVSLLASVHAQSDPDRAIEILNRGIAASDEPGPLYLLRVALLRQQNKLDEVEDAIREMIVIFPEQKSLRYQLAGFLAEQEKPDEAEKLLRETIAAYPDDITAKLKLAEFLANQRDPETAERVLKEYRAAEPEAYQFSLALARLYEATQRRGEAEDVYLEMIEQEGLGPQGLVARNKLAQINLQDRDLTAARARIEEVLAEEPSNADALLMRAGMAFNDGDTDTAIADLRRALRNDPTSQRALFMLGQAHLRDGSANLAEENFRKLLTAYPDHREASLALARLLIQQENWDDAEQLLVRVLAQKEDDLGTKRMLVDVLIRQGDWDAALSHARVITGMEGQAALGHYLQGRILQSQRRFDEAITEYRASLDVQPTALETLSGLIGSFLANNQSDAAMKFLQEYSAQFPDGFHAHTLIGQVHARAEAWDLAKASYEQAISLNPQWLPAYRDLTGIYLRNGEVDGALAITERGLEALPDNADLLLLRAGVQEQRGEYKDAIATYEAVLAQRPDLDVAMNNLAALIADHQPQTDRLQYALGLVRHFETSNNAMFLDTLGWLYYRMGDLTRAVPLLEQAVAGAGQLPQLRYHLGMAYFGSQQPERARSELQAAVGGSTEYIGLDEAKATLASL